MQRLLVAPTKYSTHRVPVVPAEVSHWDRLEQITDPTRQPAINLQYGKFKFTGLDSNHLRPAICQYSGGTPLVDIARVPPDMGGTTTAATNFSTHSVTYSVNNEYTRT